MWLGEVSILTLTLISKNRKIESKIEKKIKDKKENKRETKSTFCSLDSYHVVSICPDIIF